MNGYNHRPKSLPFSLFYPPHTSDHIHIDIIGNQPIRADNFIDARNNSSLHDLAGDRYSLVNLNDIVLQGTQSH
jgi:hypothetical protein